MLPKEYFASGLSSGISKKVKKDLAVIYSSLAAKACGVFTSNEVKAAPVILSYKRLNKNPGGIRAIVANSGCANACTGQKGIADADKTCQLAASGFGINKESVLVASTGVIGKNLPMSNIEKGLKILCGEVSKGKKESDLFAEAIMTTDTFPKIVSRIITVSGKKITIWGCVKGAGMIHPDLKVLHATMLGFILTDACITAGALKKALLLSVEDSFNCVSVDGDTSTNDTIFLLANGAAGNRIIKEKSKACGMFNKALADVCLGLAKMIARDGEGATKLVKVEVIKAKKRSDAKKIASTIATSPLFKTAMFGNDANWGRIMAAIGRSGVRIDPDRIGIKIGGITVARNGRVVDFSEKKAKDALVKKDVSILVELNLGKENSTYYTCDLSFDYVKINASYRS